MMRTRARTRAASGCSSSTTTTSSSGASACCSSASPGSSAVWPPHDGEEALELVRESKPHVALVDLFLGGQSGAEVCSALRAASPRTKILLISGAGSISPAAAAPPALRASSPRTGARRTSSRRSGWSPRDGRLRAAADRAPESPLSEREREVVSLIAAGSTNREIAAGALPLPAHGQGAHERALPQARGPQPRRGGQASAAPRADRVAGSGSHVPPEAAAVLTPRRAVPTPRTGGSTGVCPSPGCRGRVLMFAMQTALLFPARAARPPTCASSSEAVVPSCSSCAVEAVGDDPFERVADGTRFAQPALYCASLALLDRAGRPGPTSSRATRSARSARWSPAGRHLDRGRAAAGRSPRARDGGCGREPAAGGMLALLGDEDAARRDRRRARPARSPTTTPRASSSSPGPREALDARPRGAKARAACKAIRLAVRGAFHTAGDGARACRSSATALAEIDVRPPEVPVFSSVDRAARSTTSTDASSPHALVRPVRWRETLARAARPRASSASSRPGRARCSRAWSGARCRTPRRACSPGAEVAHA